MSLSGDKDLLGDGTPGSGRGCSRCRGPAWKKNDKNRASWNCDGKHPLEGASTNGFAWAPELKRCPWSLTSPKAWEYVRTWQRWKVIGVLPEHGDLLDQPADIAHALEACEWTRAEWEAREHERAKGEMERAAREAEKGAKPKR
jgi:hypothetical protein